MSHRPRSHDSQGAPSQKGLEARIARGATAHYDDPAYYDLAYKRRREDVKFYVEAAREYGSPVLELGVGTARVALSLAAAGIRVIGVDPSQSMLDHAEAKRLKLETSARTNLTLKLGDARSIRIRQRFPLVTAPFNVFMHLYSRDDLERAFRSVHAHLAPRGRFVFDVLTPDLRAMVRRPGHLLKAPAVVHPTTGRRYRYMEAFEYEPLRQVQMVSMVFQEQERPEEMTVVPLSQRQFFPQELEALLHYNGFELESRYGDFAKGPFTAESESQVIVARRRKGFVSKGPARKKSVGSASVRPSG